MFSSGVSVLLNWVSKYQLLTKQKHLTIILVHMQSQIPTVRVIYLAQLQSIDHLQLRVGHY